MAKAEEKVMIDVDAAIELYNSKQKDIKKHIDRESLAKELDTNYQNFVNYKAGRVPKIVSDLKKIMNKTGIEFNELIKEIKS